MRSGFPCYGGQNITVSHPSCKDNKGSFSKTQDSPSARLFLLFLNIGPDSSLQSSLPRLQAFINTCPSRPRQSIQPKHARNIFRVCFFVAFSILHP